MTTEWNAAAYHEARTRSSRGASRTRPPRARGSRARARCGVRQRAADGGAHQKHWPTWRWNRRPVRSPWTTPAGTSRLDAVTWPTHDAGQDTPFRATASAASYDALCEIPWWSCSTTCARSTTSARSSGLPTTPALRACVLAGITPRPPHRGLSKTALGAELTVPWTAVEDARPVIDGCARPATRSPRSKPRVHAVDLFDWRPRFPVCVVFGHEVDGISPSLQEACDTFVRLPTLGVEALAERRDCRRRSVLRAIAGTGR